MKNLSVSVKYGIGIGLALIGVFLLLSIFGLHTKPFYSAINIVIVGIGLFGAIRVYKTEHQKDNLKKFSYQKGFRVGVVTGFLATIVFTIFFAIYTSNIQPDFISNMMVNWDSGYEVGVGTVSFIVFLMGIATTVVLSLTFMQILKDSWNTTQGKRYTVSGTDDSKTKNRS